MTARPASGTGTVLVAGATGLVGQAVLERYAEEPGWKTVGLARRTGTAPAGATLVAADLTDPESCVAAVAAHPEVTHLVYAAVAEAPGLAGGWQDAELIERNTAMLGNLMSALGRHAPGLVHVTLLQGSKAYGIHLADRPVRAAELPLRERSPRIEHANFYFSQESLLTELQRSASWTLTVVRPTVVYGGAWGANMNPLLPIAVLASLQAAAGEALPVPWPADRPTTYAEAVDADLLAEAVVWAGRAEAAQNRTFNVTNGDLFVWDAVWPAIADACGVALGAHTELSFARDVAPRAAEWARVVAEHGLVSPTDLTAFVGANSFVYADRIVAGQGARGQVPLNSTIALREAGFTGCLDTEDMFRRQLERLQRSAVIPPANRHDVAVRVARHPTTPAPQHPRTGVGR